MRNALLSLTLLAATGCSLMIDPDGVEPPAVTKTVQSIAVTAAGSLTLPKGTTVQLTATATYTDSTTGDVTAQAAWSSSATGTATVSNVAGTKGLAKAEAATGSATITATLQGISGTATINAQPAAVVSITVTPASTPALVRGTTVQLTATATYTDTTTGPVTSLATWTSSDATVASVSDASGTKGLVTAVKAGGPVTLTATYGTVSGAASVTVTLPTVTSIAVTPATATLLAGGTVQLVATATLSDTTTADVTASAAWTSAASGTVSVSASGVASAVAVGGPVLITATYGGKSGTASLSVTGASVTGVTVTPAAPSIPKGATAQLTATATLSDTTTIVVTEQASWSSNATAVATVSTTPGTRGQVKAVAASGPATITATFGGVSGSTIVTATPAEVETIAVTPATTSLPKGAKQQLTAIATYTDATTLDVTANVATTWTSSSDATATVSTTGEVTAAAASGSATLTATFGGKSGTATVTAGAAVVATLEVTPATASVPIGATLPLTATATYTDGLTVDVTANAATIWASSNTGVATVSATGVVTGIATSGTSTVTATFGGKSDFATITGAVKAVKQIDVTPNPVSLAAGETLNLTATATYTDLSTADVTASANWGSNAPGVASVSTTAPTKGKVTAVSASATPAVITATFGSKSGTVDVTVTPADVVSIAITPAAPVTGVGGTVQLFAEATYTDGSKVDVTDGASWSPTTGTIAKVSDTAGTKGLVTGVAVGSATISASFGGQLGQVSVTIQGITSIAVTGYSSPVPAGKTVQLVATATLSGGGTQDVTEQATWTPTTGTIATVSDAAGTKGLVTAVAKGGPVTIQASLSGKTGSQAVSVTDPLLESITVEGYTAALPNGTTVQLTAMGHYSNSTTAPVTSSATWTSLSTAVATVNDTTAKGLVTAKAATGTAVIRATVGGLSGEVTVAVTDPVVNSVTVTPTPLSLAKGQIQQLVATAAMSDGTSRNVAADALTAWTGGNAYVSVSTTGLVTAQQVGGPYAITATYGGKSGAAQVTVRPAELANVNITPAPMALPVGAHQQLAVTGTLTDGTQQDLTGTATFSIIQSGTLVTIGAGPADRAMLRAVAEGTAIISATATLGSITLTSSFVDVMVGPVALVSIELTVERGDNWNPYSPTALAYTPTPDAYIGRAYGTWSDGRVLELTSLAAWTSAGAISVSTDAATRGRITTLAPGAGTLQASYAGVTGTLDLSVHTPVVIWIVPFPGAMSMPTNSTFKGMTAAAVFDDWTIVDVTESVDWTAGPEGIVSVSNTAGSKGDVTSYSLVGSTLVTATDPGSGIDASTAIVVEDKGPFTFRIVPGAPVVSIVRDTRLTAILEYGDGSLYDVSWSSDWSSSDPATIDVSPQDGTAYGLKAGSAAITAWYPRSPDTTHASTVPATVGVGDAMIQFSAPPYLQPGQSVQLQAWATPYDEPSATPVNVTDMLTWSTYGSPYGDFYNPAMPGYLTAGSGCAGTCQIWFGAASGDRQWSGTAWITSYTFTSLSLTSPTVPLGAVGRLAAKATLGSGEVVDVTDYATWTSGNPGVLQLIPGPPATVEGVAAGSSVVTATFNGMTASATVRVNGTGVTAITVSPAVASVGAGTEWSGPTVGFHAAATFGDNSTGDITPFAHWSTTDSTIAYPVGFPANEFRGLKAGEKTLVVASYGQAAATAELQVTAAVPNWLQLDGPWTLYQYVPTQFHVRGYFDGGAARLVTEDATWSSSDTSIVKVDDNPGSKGRVTVTGMSGMVEIRATFSGGSYVSRWVGITSYGYVIWMNVSPYPVPVTAGGTAQVFAYGDLNTCPSCADLTYVASWASMDPNVATVEVGMNESGSLGAWVRGRVPGSTQVCASFDTFYQCTTVNVGWPMTNTVTVEYYDPTNWEGRAPCQGSSYVPAEFPAGSAFQLKACLKADNGGSYDVTGFTSWWSNDPSIAAVSDLGDRKGFVSLRSSIGPAMTSIQAQYAGWPAVSYPVNLSATSSLDFLRLDNDVAAIRPGASGGMGMLQVYAYFTDGSSRPATADAVVSFADPTVATLGGEDSERRARYIVGLEPRSTTMEVTYPDPTLVSGTKTVNMMLHEDARLYVDLAVGMDGPVKIPIGAPVRAWVLAYDPVGFPWDVTDAGAWGVPSAYVPAWSSTNPEAATVTNAVEPRGVVTGLAPGFTDIVVSLDGLSAKLPVEVTDAYLTSLAISPDFQAAPGGGIALQPFKAIATYSDGSQFDVTRFASWAGDGYVVPAGALGEFKTNWYGSGRADVYFGGLNAGATVVSF